MLAKYIHSVYEYVRMCIHTVCTYVCMLCIPMCVGMYIVSTYGYLENFQ